jgi:hypothetical protein
MLHIATVHHASPRWIEIQTSYMRRHISVPYQTWTSLEGIDPSYGVHFDHVISQKGMHAAKLNGLAMEICNVASDDDLVMFFDGDAFPIADPVPLITDGLAQAPLVAVRRAENANEPQPHPCFCVTRVRTWRTLPGEWTAGYTWTGTRGRPTSAATCCAASSSPARRGSKSSDPIAKTSTRCTSRSMERPFITMARD